MDFCVDSAGLCTGLGVQIAGGMSGIENRWEIVDCRIQFFVSLRNSVLGWRKLSWRNLSGVGVAVRPCVWVCVCVCILCLYVCVRLSVSVTVFVLTCLCASLLPPHSS